LLLPLWHESVQGQFLLESSNRAVVRAMVPGTVQGVFAAEGQTVEAGQPLVSLASLPLQAKLSKTRADYTLASMLATDAELRHSGYGPALLERKRFAEQTRYVTQEMASLEIDSPVSGVVMTPGLQDRVASYVTAGTELAEVADLSEMRARIFVSEHDMYRLKVGSAARLYVNGFLRTWDTTVLTISPRSTEIDAALEEERKFQGLRPPNFYVAEMRISNPGLVLKPGMQGFARIYGRRTSVAEFLWKEVWQFVQRKIW